MKKETKNKGQIEKSKNMFASNLAILIIVFNMNGLNTPIKI